MTTLRMSGSRPVDLTEGRRSVPPLPAGFNPRRPAPGTPGFIGATSREPVDGGRHRRSAAPLAWLPHAALAALVAVLLLVVLAAALAG